MYLYQNNKLYVDKNNKYVGASITPTSTVIHNEITTTFKNGLLLTTEEVRAKFGDTFNSFDEGETNGKNNRSKKTTKHK